MTFVLKYMPKIATRILDIRLEYSLQPYIILEKYFYRQNIRLR